MAFTFFFRDRFILENLCTELLPKFTSKNIVKVWDAGCALGQEPYTFAIIMAEMVGDKNIFGKLRITATDLDPNDTFASVVKEAVYVKYDLSRMPENILDKYFVHWDDDHYQLIDWVKNILTFYKQDLVNLEPIDTDFDAIICKNVLLHLSQEERINVINMFGRSLAQDGLLILEQTQPLPDECKDVFKKLNPDSSIYRKSAT